VAVDGGLVAVGLATDAFSCEDSVASEVASGVSVGSAVGVSPCVEAVKSASATVVACCSTASAGSMEGAASPPELHATLAITNIDNHKSNFSSLRNARGGLPNPPFSTGFDTPAGANRDLLNLNRFCVFMVTYLILCNERSLFLHYSALIQWS
jgi:hypothetical protein